MRFDGDIIITDPCYIMGDHGNDWEKCNYGDSLHVLGFSKYISEHTLYGDWSCATFHLKAPLGKRSLDSLKEKDFTSPVLGEFCADAVKVAVLLLDEVLKYNPDFDYHITRTWTTTLIQDFHGEVEYVIHNDEAFVVGTGNINFITRQTGS